MPEMTRVLLIAMFLIMATPVKGGELTSLSRQKPYVVNTTTKEVYLYTEHNDKVKKSTHLGIVYERGSMAEKSLFIAFISPLDFYNLLLSLGAKPGDNLNEHAEGQVVKGTLLEVKLLINGKYIEVAEVIEDSSKRGFLIRFGGNIERQNKLNTGCIMCLESCYAGITSNEKLPLTGNLKRFFNPNAVFRVRDNFSGQKSYIFVFRVKQ